MHMILTNIFYFYFKPFSHVTVNWVGVTQSAVKINPMLKSLQSVRTVVFFADCAVFTFTVTFSVHIRAAGICVTNIGFSSNGVLARPRFVRLHFAVVIELLIAALTQLLLRALIIFLRSGGGEREAPWCRDDHQLTVAGEFEIKGRCAAGVAGCRRSN